MEGDRPTGVRERRRARRLFLRQRSRGGPVTPRVSNTATKRGLWRHVYAEFLKLRTLLVVCVTIAMFVAAMAIFGPLGTSVTLPPLRRLYYWGLSALAAFPFCYATQAAVLYVMRSRSLVEIMPAVAANVLFEGVICTAVIHTADTLFRPGHAGGASLPAIFLTATTVMAICTFFVHYVVFLRVLHDGPGPFADRAPQSAAGSGAAAGGVDPGGVDPGRVDPGGARHGNNSTGSGGVPRTQPRPTPSQQRFHARLPDDVSRDVVYLKVDDHYVEVHTTGGSCLLLMDLRSAVAELGDLGMQVHRSYWIARSHVTATVRRDGRTMLRVTGGDLVPVSRTYLPAVRDALRLGARKRPETGGSPG